ncbi:MAG: ribosomal RNA small subunit methyltransferase A [Planctomycetes bacterium]|nr:ribosomal RNA small subunit methyltransferase A [Planctomycetota bacterium]
MLQAYGLSPLHRLGQNFLHDHNILQKLVDASGVECGDLVLEIGPGTGTLTETLLDRGCTVIACELDRGLAGLLQDRLGDAITLIHGDCLVKKHLNPRLTELLANRNWKLVANLPYQIASPLIVDVLANHQNCLGQFVTIQYEVSQRLMAKVNSKDWGVLSILVQRLATISLVTKAPNTCFWPQPKITSACVAIVPHKNRPQRNEEFAEFVTSLFAKRRKQLGSILGREFEFPEGITSEQRPATLSIQQLEQLFAITNTSKDSI